MRLPPGRPIMAKLRQLLAGLSPVTMPKTAATRAARAQRLQRPLQVQGVDPVSTIESAEHGHEPADASRRDFLYIATGAVGGVGAALALWPFISQMNPDASVRALASIEVDLSPIAEGQSITVKWRGNPVFVRHQTPDEIEAAKAVSVEELPDPVARNGNLPEGAPATYENRVVDGKEQWLVQMGVCTHLGCVPLGEQGEYAGWFCPCHGSHYDTAGRIRKGPAPENLHIPAYQYLSDDRIQIG
jgi:ubiquinol-cytochrome c reductase iron-sulfur subunit